MDIITRGYQLTTSRGFMSNKCKTCGVEQIGIDLHTGIPVMGKVQSDAAKIKEQGEAIERDRKKISNQAKEIERLLMDASRAKATIATLTRERDDERKWRVFYEQQAARNACVWERVVEYPATCRTNNIYHASDFYGAGDGGVV